jgi:uncharacterized protein (UPF0335 family)
MSDFAKMDIFFVVTTIAVVIVAVLLSYAIYRVIRILRHVEHVSELVSEEGDRVRDDIAHMRSTVKSEGFKLSLLTSFLKRRKKRFTENSDS